MSFSRAQHITHYRPMVDRAWKRLYDSSPALQDLAPPQRKVARREWYERELAAATGKKSSEQCNAGKDFEKAMAHFEAIAGDSIEWQLKLYTGDARRILHEIRDLVRHHDLDEDYARGIARQALKLDALPDITELDAKDLVVVLRALKIQVARPRQSTAPARELPF
jgi:hypothetical protein